MPSLRIKSRETISHGLRRVALAAAEEAIENLAQPTADDAIHETRKRLKELRALMRLASAAMPDKGRAPRAALRDAGHRLADARDRQALVESFDALGKHFADRWGPRRFQKIRKTLVQRASVVQEPDLEAVDEVRTTIRIARRAVTGWAEQLDTFTSIEGSLRRSYASARRQMRRAGHDHTPEALHEWRKRVKEHWVHAQAIEDIWPAIMKPYEQSLHDLSRKLGDHHDLAMLRGIEPPIASPRVLRQFRGDVSQRMDELEAEAERLGMLIFEEKPQAWIRRIRGYWTAWRETTRQSRPRKGPKAAPRRIDDKAAGAPAKPTA
jgi:CHAD domain-containing protein